MADWLTELVEDDATSWSANFMKRWTSTAGFASTRRNSLRCASLRRSCATSTVPWVPSDGVLSDRASQAEARLQPTHGRDPQLRLQQQLDPRSYGRWDRSSPRAATKSMIALISGSSATPRTNGSPSTSLRSNGEAEQRPDSPQRSERGATFGPAAQEAGVRGPSGVPVLQGQGKEGGPNLQGMQRDRDHRGMRKEVSDGKE